ncbi:glutamine cyclotransferase [Nitzschia inconspicua]|uniref:Glutamine cyclotransferase n=1 Tax=Nitzschia inconspicua TaxID=303405 RepID=A0A9K3PTI5_9STRA|nr:glutamine cyclotransferase [Nitzschia inconspicua]
MDVVSDINSSADSEGLEVVTTTSIQQKGGGKNVADPSRRLGPGPIGDYQPRPRPSRRRNYYMIGCSVVLLISLVVTLAVVLTVNNQKPTKEIVSNNNSLSIPGSSSSSSFAPATPSITHPPLNQMDGTVSPFFSSTHPITVPTTTTSPPTASIVVTSPPSFRPSNNVGFLDAVVSTETPTEDPTSSPLLLSSATPQTVSVPNVTTRASFELLETLPHDPMAFTQGLEVLSLQRLWYGQNNSSSSNNTTTTITSTDYFLESTGLYGQSSLRLVDIPTGSVLEQINLPDSDFGEGCTYYQVPSDDPNIKTLKVVQLTWRSGVGAVYELNITTDTTTTSGTTTAPIPLTLQNVGSFGIDTTNGEGWGIVYHPTLDQFIVTDGTSNLHFWELRDDDTGGGNNLVFERVKTIPVQRRFSADQEWTQVQRLNELEWDPHSYGGNTILANIWEAELVVRIRLEDGIVSHQYNFESLDRPADVDVLNGIAAVWDSASSSGDDTTDQFWVTGKLWPQMYRVRLID